MEFEIELILIFIVLKLLTAVLLIADDRFQPTFRQVQRVVPYGFVVLNLLEGQGLRVGLYVVCSALGTKNFLNNPKC